MYLGGSRHFLALRRTGMMSPKETEETSGPSDLFTVLIFSAVRIGLHPVLSATSLVQSFKTYRCVCTFMNKILQKKLYCI